MFECVAHDLSPNLEEKDVEETLMVSPERFSLRNSLSIALLLNPEEENSTDHLFLNDEKIANDFIDDNNCLPAEKEPVKLTSRQNVQVLSAV